MRWEGSGQTGNVEDRRGTVPAVAGGGIVTLVTLALVYFFGVDPNKAQQIAQQVGGGGGGTVVKGPPPNDKMLAFSKSILGMTDKVWAEQFQARGQEYQRPGMVLFTERVDSEGCGIAPAAVGPFYCPASKKLFVDPTFFDELERKLGGSKAEFSQAYVIAHEVGHHVQNLLGYNELVERYRAREGENAGIRLELQADYLAGVWAHHAEKQFRILERGDVESALKTARAIGDNRIQEKAGRWASPESFNHGTDAQRMKYFSEGLKTGDASKAALDRFFNQRVRPLEL